MRRAVLSIAILVVALGVAASSYLLLDGTGVPDLRAPDVARITCEPERVHLESTSVRARADGVHFSVANLSRALFVEIASPGSEAERLPLTPGLLEEATFALAPGRVSVACVSGREIGRSRPPASLEIVDPQGLWISPRLACDDTESAEIEVMLSDEGAAETFARSIPGLTQVDELVKPGYPDTLWHGDLLVVVREGETVARVTRAQSEGMWDVSIDACPGTGLTDI